MEPVTDDEVSGAIVSQVHDQLRRAILRCELAPGSAISQVKVAKEFGISRTPLREVLRLLEREGLVEAQHNHRYRVVGFSLDDMVDVYASRLLHEALATRHSMRNMSPAVLDQLRTAYDDMSAATDVSDHDAWQVAHRRFHGVLNAGGGARIVASIEQLTDYADRYRRIYGSQAPLAWRTGLRQHLQIVKAAERFDAEGTSAAVASHIAQAAIKLIQSVEPSHDISLIRHALKMCGVEMPAGEPAKTTAG